MLGRFHTLLARRGITTKAPKPWSCQRRLLSTRPSYPQQEWNGVDEMIHAARPQSATIKHEDKSHPFKPSSFHDNCSTNNKLSLERFVQKVPDALRLRKEMLSRDFDAFQLAQDPVLSLFR